MADETPRFESLFRFSHPHRVRYDEVDAQGIVGSASWLNLLQLGRVEYMRHLGLVLEGNGRSPLQAVVRRASVEHLAPARFDEPLVIRVRTSYLGRTSAKLEYLVDNAETGLRPLMGETLIVCVEMPSLRSLPWPEVWRQRVHELEGDNVRGGRR
jgi:acyl-CoA thioester hydrolase